MNKKVTKKLEKQIAKQLKKLQYGIAILNLKKVMN